LPIGLTAEILRRSPGVWRTLFAVVVMLVLACGDSSGTAGEPPTRADEPSADGGGGGVSPEIDSGPPDEAASASLAVAPATATTIVSGAPVHLVSTLSNASGAVAWMLVGPGSLSSLSGPSTTYTPPVKGRMGVARVTATAGALSATSSIRVNVPPRQSVVAYAWANDAFTASYTPLADYSYNASGGPVVASRGDVGAYAMTFSGLDVESGDVQVTSVLDDARCSVGGRLGSSVDIRCFDWLGAPVDANYMVSIVVEGALSVASVVAYATAGPGNSTANANDTYVFNASLGAVYGVRLATGIHRVRFNALPKIGNIQVTAWNSDKACNISSWDREDIYVRCYDPAGALADSAYTVIAYGVNRTTTANVAAYAWANQPSLASYTPSTSSYNSGGGAIAAARSAVGTYAISFSGLNLSDGAVKVTANGTGHHCNVLGYSVTTVDVRCYDSSGALSDSTYTVLVVLNNYPLLSSVAGYAWADQPTSASYTPNAAHSYNARGGDIVVNRNAVGRYTMTFADLTAGNVQVSPFGSSARCGVTSVPSG
jgi:hypothetical protein